MTPELLASRAMEPVFSTCRIEIFRYSPEFQARFLAILDAAADGQSTFGRSRQFWGPGWDAQIIMEGR